MNEVIVTNHNMGCHNYYGWKEALLKHGWREGKQAAQLLNQLIVIYYLSPKVVLTSGRYFYGPHFILIIIFIQIKNTQDYEAPTVLHVRSTTDCFLGRN